MEWTYWLACWEMYFWGSGRRGIEDDYERPLSGKLLQGSKFCSVPFAEVHERPVSGSVMARLSGECVSKILCCSSPKMIHLYENIFMGEIQAISLLTC
jgi:hypothetical protein